MRSCFAAILVAGLTGSASAAPIDLSDCDAFEEFPFREIDNTVDRNVKSELIEAVLGKKLAELTDDDLNVMRGRVSDCVREKGSEEFSGVPFYIYQSQTLDRIGRLTQERDAAVVDRLAPEKLDELLARLRIIEGRYPYSIPNRRFYVISDVDLAEIEQIVGEARDFDDRYGSSIEIELRSKTDPLRSQHVAAMNQIEERQTVRGITRELPSTTTSRPSGRSADGGLLVTYYTMFIVAEECEKAGASFNSSEIGSVTNGVAAFSESFDLPKDRKDEIWDRLDTNRAALTSNLTYEACAQAKHQITFMLPGVFATGNANPFR